MSPQRYEAVNAVGDDDGDHSPLAPKPDEHIPSSPPPSFRSRASSPTSRRLLAEDPLTNEADHTLADTFDDGDASDAENDGDDRQRLMRAGTNAQRTASDADDISPTPQRRVTELPAFRHVTSPGQNRGPSRPTNDGVFANLSAKPERGQVLDEKPPTYEQAAADATPPYWETTIVAPGMSGDEVYVDGLPVGSVFSFVWNGMISMSFQLVGFLLTYLLHTTHAAKNGSRAGLGLTLVQYGFYMKGSGITNDGQGNPGQFAESTPPDPNSHSFDPNVVNDSAASAASASATSSGLMGISSSDWVSYILMIVGWFILIRSISEFLRARRHEQLVLQSPTRGLSTPIVVEGEGVETVA